MFTASGSVHPYDEICRESQALRISTCGGPSCTIEVEVGLNSELSGGREREREGERERRGLPSPAYGAASYLTASWWMVDSRMARLGEHGIPPGLSVQ